MREETKMNRVPVESFEHDGTTYIAVAADKCTGCAFLTPYQGHASPCCAPSWVPSCVEVEGGVVRNIWVKEVCRA